MNLEQIRDLLRLLEERDVAEFEIEEEGLKLRIRKTANGAAPAPANPLPPVAPVPSTVTAAVPFVAAEPPPPPASTEAGLVTVKSPIVGTFYRSPDPNSQPFVNVGDKVKVGQVLCIVEAMKLMNEIEAELGGEIVTIHPESGQPVQYGEPLFTIRPGK